MTPLEIRRENARREREQARKQRGKLPERTPAPESFKEAIARIKEELRLKKEQKE